MIFFGIGGILSLFSKNYLFKKLKSSAWASIKDIGHRNFKGPF